MNNQQNGITTNSGVPEWLDNVTLEQAIKQQVGAFNKILDIKTENSSSNGENYSSLMMRIKTLVETEGRVGKLLQVINFL